MKFNRKLFKEAFKAGYKKAKRLSENYYEGDNDYYNRFDQFEPDNDRQSYERFPVWALDFFMTGDVGDLSDEELELATKYKKALGSVEDYSDREYYCKHPLFGPPCECVDVIMNKSIDDYEDDDDIFADDLY